MSNSINHILCVCIITYNHVKYIEQAIDGVLMQKVDFLYEILIADDYSSDGTREIIIKYQKQYPNLIKLILQEKNIGPAKNWIKLISTPNSKYIAYFEGDDYWTDPFKLQKQVDFLEKNEDYVLCGTSYNDSNHNLINKYQNSDITTNNLIYYNPYGTLTVVFKNIIRKNDLLKSLGAPLGDYYLWFYLHQFGKGFVLKDNTAVYRLHENSIFSSKSYIVRLVMRLKTFDNVYCNLDKSDILKYEIVKSALEIGRVANWNDYLNTNYSLSVLIKNIAKINIVDYPLFIYVVVKSISARINYSFKIFVK